MARGGEKWLQTFDLNFKTKNFGHYIDFFKYTFGSLVANKVSMIPVRKFSTESTPSRITKSSPTPKVNMKFSVNRAASRLSRPAKSNELINILIIIII